MRVFGLDIGTTSIGFAVVELDEARDQGAIVQAPGCPGLGVRIFPEARDPDGTPLNQQRRAKRMMRRQLRRRKHRRRALNELLAAHGLLPAFGGPEWAKAMAADPYSLRAKGLSEPLTPHELGRALYHLAKRRHFKERDLAEAGEADNALRIDDAADGKQRRKPKAEPKASAGDDEARVAEARAHFIAELNASGQTLGQALALRPKRARRRGEHATRAIVESEFRRLVEVQAPYHPILRDAGRREAIQATIFAQRPVFWRKSTLGTCRFIPDAPLCPKGSWLSQQRRMLEKLNNLAIAGGNARPLDAEERAAILAVLQTQKKMSWSGVRNALEPIFKARGESTKYVRFNLEYGDEKGGLNGNVVEADLEKIFGAQWADHPHKQALRAFVPDALWSADYGEIGTQRVVIRGERDRAAKRSTIVGRLVQEFDATRDQADAIVKLHFPQGWEPYSVQALEKFLPELEKGVRFGSLLNSPEWTVWRDQNFPNREQPTGEILDLLPSPKDRDEARRIAQLRNPTVGRVQNELRKVVNNLIRVYGKPDMIRVELARTIGLSKEEREERTKGMRASEKRREQARKDLRENNIEPSDADIDKWVLWQECQKKCPYTGDPICFEDLFRTNRFQIEHIWPRSISFDDGLRNKTLCRTDVNIAKGNRIPFEHFRNRPDEWARIKDQLDGLVRDRVMPRGKAKRFVAESIKDDFAGRQIVDTSYAARQAIAMLKRLWPDVGSEAPVKVQAVAGRVTAQLRKLWRLNHLLGPDGEKNRADHRHHAIDALVVACTKPGTTQRLARYFEREDLYRKGLGSKPDQAECPPPWPMIREDANVAKDKIVVSHRVRKRVSGPLHDERPLGYTETDITKNGVTLGIFVKRMPVESLNLEALKIEQPQEISRVAKFVVRDPAIRHTLLTHLNAAGSDPKKAYPPYPRLNANGPEIRKVRVLTTQQKQLMRPALNGFVDPANNHHIAIYRLPDGVIDFDTVSLLDVAKRLSRKEEIIRRDRGGEAEFMMSLCPGDTIYFPFGDKEGYWIVQGAWANGQVVLTRDRDARPSTLTEAKRLGVGDKREEFLPSPGGIIQRGGRKVSVDPVGRVRPAND